MKPIFYCVAASCLLLTACGPAPLPTHPVSGTVTKKGQPVAGAAVTFVPDSADGRSAVGVTDANGAFKLTTQEQDDGAMLGSYKVTVAK